MGKYKISITRPAWIVESYEVTLDSSESPHFLKKSGGKLDNKDVEFLLDDNAIQLTTEVSTHMDEDERRLFGFEVYLDEIEKEGKWAKNH